MKAFAGSLVHEVIRLVMGSQPRSEARWRGRNDSV